MTRQLMLHSLTLDLGDDQATYKFEIPISVISGAYGTGKSSLLELIKHAFGGTATLTPAVQDNVRRIALTALIGDRRLILRRPTQGNTGMVDVIDPTSGMIEQQLHVRSRGERPTISSFLLNQLQLPHTVIPSSRARARGKTTTITFNSIYNYLYLEQMEIDRSVVHHLDSVREPTRRAVFELLFGLADTVSFGLEVQIGKLHDKITQAKAEARTVRTFLEQSEAPEEEVLRERRLSLTAEAQAAAARLRGLREQVARRSTLHDELRAQLRNAVTVQTRAEATHDAARVERDERRALVAQLQLDLARLDRAATADRLLAPFEILTCPRCMQSVDGRAAPGGHCTLCLQEVPLNPTERTDDAAARERVISQLAETTQLLEQDESRMDVASGEVDRARLTVAVLTRDLDMRTRDVVSPLFDQIAEESASLARFNAELMEIDRLHAFWQQVRDLDNRAARFEDDYSRLTEELRIAQSTFIDRSERLNDLSTLFDETVQFLNVPWYRSARIDPTNYLPVVNDTRFEQLTASGGGIATVVNLAYHLTLLSYSLAEGNLLRPGLLVVDSPRKNLGKKDDSTMVAFYRRLETITGEYRNRVQVIVADNDPPPGESRIKSSIEFDYQHPMVPGVEHPGPEQVRPIGYMDQPAH